MSIFGGYLGHVDRTIFGFYQRPFCSQWDEVLKELIEKGEVISLGSYTMSFLLRDKKYEVWVENRWYCYGSLYTLDGRNIGNSSERRPRFSTMKKLDRLHSSMVARRSHEEYQQLLQKIRG